MDRRSFLQGMFAAGVTAGAGLIPNAAHALRQWPENRWLHLVNPHTGETLHEWYVYEGRYLEDTYRRFCRLVRDWRAGEAVAMHPSLMDMLFALHYDFRVDGIKITSGYRTPQTNRQLEGAARNSQHLRGLALDIVVPNRKSGDVAQTLRDLIPGGIGWYPSKGFVHADLGPRRTWTGR